MNNEIEVLSGWESVLHRPSLYIGKHSIYGLQCFISGLSITNSNIFFNDFGFEFDTWVRKKLSVGKNNKSFEHALEQADGDDEKAFGVWADWFKEYKSSEIKEDT